MNERLRILHLEDEPDYSQLIRELLAKEGVCAEVALATNRAEFEAALAREKFDIVLADYTLPGYTGIEALELVRARLPEAPFLLVSGTIGEQAAIEGMRAGATDYVLKQTPERLVPAVRRAVEEAQERVRRRHAEAELIRREKYFRALSDNSLDIITLLNIEGVFEFNSPSVERVLGYKPGELVGQSAFALIHPDDMPGVLKGFQHGLDHPDEAVTLEFRFRHRNGSWVQLEAVGQNRLADPEIAAVVVNSRDITSRKRAEQDLRESEQRFRDLFEYSPDAILVEAADGKVLDVNEAACRLHGLRRENLIGMNGLDLVPENHRREITRDFHKLLSGDITRVECESVSADGRVTPVEVHGRTIHYRGGNAVLLHVRDTSERIHAEGALRRSEMLFRSVWENSVDGMRLTDRDGYIVAVNGAFCELVDMTRDELEGEPFTVVYGDNEHCESILVEYQESFQARAFRRKIERQLKLRSGNQILLEHTTSFVELPGQPPMLLGLFRDLTAQKRLEEQLRQSQKMDAIGQLAGGIAHDFNNMLTVIHGHASLLLSGGDLMGEASASVGQIVQAAERAAGLTRQLLAFSRRQMMQPRRVDLNEVVSGMASMLSRMLGEDVALELCYWPVPAMLRADAGMLEQVLLNLAVNARDAMPRGGQLHIRTAVADIERPCLPHHPDNHPGRFVCLTATDTGCGIPPEIVDRIFEPFFTTKEAGKGTGLGLATVYGIVKQHNGWIEVESKLGQGTTFRVHFPAVGDEGEELEDGLAEMAVRGGSETILVVEDEQLVSELVCNLLRGYGYRILEASCGAQALEVWREHKDKIALVVTDVVMPGPINGRELAEMLWADRAGLRVILTSGYSADVAGREWVVGHGLNYLQKPYHPRSLALAVRDCLDASKLASAT